MIAIGDECPSDCVAAFVEHVDLCRSVRTRAFSDGFAPPGVHSIQLFIVDHHPSVATVAAEEEAAPRQQCATVREPRKMQVRLEMEVFLAHATHSSAE